METKDVQTLINGLFHNHLEEFISLFDFKQNKFTSEEIYNCTTQMIKQDLQSENFSEDFKANVEIKLFEAKSGLIHFLEIIREMEIVDMSNININQINEFIIASHLFISFYKEEKTLFSMLKNLHELSRGTDDNSKTKYEFIKTFINKE